MAIDFTKRTYIDGETVITADNLNDIQDAVLELDAEKYEKPSGGIPSSDLNSSAQAMLLPSGGTVGQVLSKKSSSNYDVEWADGGSGGTSDYTDLTNKPQINSHTLTGNQSAADLGLGTYSKPSGGIPDTDLSAAVQTSLGKADTALQTAPVSSVDGKTGAVTVLPSGGSSGQVLKKNSSTDYDVFWGNESGGGGGGTSDYLDLSNKPQINSVTLSGNLSAADLGLGTYSKPSGGIPDTDLSSSVQTSLGLANTSYQKPSGGIPASDIASGVIPSASSATPQDLGVAAAGSSADFSRADHVHDMPSASDIGAYVKPSGGIPASDLASGVIPTAYTSNPAMDGTASPGSTGQWADGGHVHPSDTSKQDSITATGILKGAGSGSVSAATKGTDFGALAFTVTLTTAGWSSNAQTVSNANFIASGYGYIVSPASDSFSDYASAQIYADDVTVAGQMTFHCTEAPSAALTVNVLRVVSA